MNLRSLNRYSLTLKLIKLIDVGYLIFDLEEGVEFGIEVEKFDPEEAKFDIEEFNVLPEETEIDLEEAESDIKAGFRIRIRIRTDPHVFALPGSGSA